MPAAPKPVYWRNKRVMLTGHTGFKGSWLSEMLLGLGAEVYGLSLEPDTDPSLFAVLDLADRLAGHQIGDIRDREQLADAIARVEPDIVLHLAAQSIVYAGYEDPISTLETNVMGTANLLEAVRRHCADIPVVVASSDKCYANNGQRRYFLESDPLGGKDPYSASKAGTEIVCAAYRSSYFSGLGAPRLASVRAGNVLGGGDWTSRRIMPDLMRGFDANEPVVIRSPDATRPWQHVLEPITGYLICAEALTADRTVARAWNFGPPVDEEHSVAEVVSIACDAWKDPTRIEMDPDAGKYPEAATLGVDSTAARSKLRWSTVLDFEQTIRWTVDWYKAFYSHAAVAPEFTREQISAYLALLSEPDT